MPRRNDAKALEWQRINRHKFPEREADRRRKEKLVRKYGLTVEQYDEMHEIQDGKCAICRRVCSTHKRLAVDHCHKTGRVRALLCNSCNRGIGFLGDDPDRAEAVAAYLRLHRY